nr:hypothetical protein [Tanacetum cinerariifolium]
MARLQFCDYHNMVAILEKSEHNVDFHPIVDFVEASPLGRNLKLQDEEGISSLPDTELFENLTRMGYNISPNQKFTFQNGRIVPFFDTMLVPQGEGSGTSTEPHHTPSSEAYPTSYTTHSSLTLPPITTASIPTVTLSEITPIRQYTRRARIAQSSAFLPVADEPASPLRDVSEGEACPIDSGFGADQDRATIAKTSTLPHDSAPRVTSPAAAEGSMQQTLNELTAFCTCLQRQHSDLISKFEAKELEINRLKARVKLLEDIEGVNAERSRDDAPIKGRNLDEGEAAAERVSDDTEEMATVLTYIDAATVLASGVAEVPTGSGSIPTAGPPAAEVPTGSDVVPTAGPIFATATVMDIQMARQLEEEMERDAQWMNEQIARDAEIARIHSEEELGMTFEEIKAKFATVWKQLEDFIPMGSKEEAERLKRKGLSLEQESVKKLKTSEEVTEEAKSPDEVPEEKVKEMMQLVPIEEVYVEALQVKHPIIDWKLWALVKESLSNRPPTSDKEMELWVELKRLYEPDDEDQLWTHTQNLMHDPVEWKLYDTCGVHHVTAKYKEIFMLVEKDYPLRKGIEFPLPEAVPTASEESCHCQKKREATAVKIAPLLKSRRNCQSKSDDSYAKKNTSIGAGDVGFGRETRANLFNISGVTHDAVMLCVFPITLTGAAKRWVDRLSPGTLDYWDLLKKAFIQRYCSPSKTAKQLEEIRNFKKEGDETLYQASERYNDMLYKCPTHDINSHQKVNIFYNGLGGSEGRRTIKSLAMPTTTKRDESREFHSFLHYWKFKFLCYGRLRCDKRPPIGTVENVLFKIDKFLFPLDFMVIDTLNTCYETMILGRAFLATIHAEIDVFNKEISLGIGDDRVTFDIDNKIHNFTTPVGKVCMVNLIHNEEPTSSSNAPSDMSPQSNNLHHTYWQEQNSKEVRMLKPDTNTLNVHFCNPIKQNCNGTLKVWPTCDPSSKLRNEGSEIYGVDEQYAEWCYENSIPDTPTSIFTSKQEDCKLRPRDHPFKEWLLTKVGHTNVSEPVKKALLKSCLIDCFQKELVKDPRSMSFNDYKWMSDLEIDQLADEYELEIRKKGHILDDIWGNCKKVQGDNTYWWRDQKLEEGERREIRVDIEGKRKRIKVQRDDPKKNGREGSSEKAELSVIATVGKAYLEDKLMKEELMGL